MKVGDKLRVLRDSDGNVKPGRVGELVEFGHALDMVWLLFSDGKRWLFDLDEVELVKDDEVEPVIKDTNPKDGIGLLKAALSVLPLPPLYEAALANTEGSFKYGRHNYREAGIRYSVYFDAMMRHLTSWFEGEDKAQDSQVHHLGHIIANCCIVLDDILRDEPIGIDDRPPETHTDWMASFSERVAALRERYPEPKPPYTR